MRRSRWLSEVSSRSDIGDKLFSEALERVAEPLPRVKVAPQPSGGQHAAKEAAAGQPRVELLRGFFEQLALRLAHLERRRMAEVTKVVQVVV